LIQLGKKSSIRTSLKRGNMFTSSKIADYFFNYILTYRSIFVTVNQRHVFDCNLSQAKILEALCE